MSDKQPMQADGGQREVGKPDGVGDNATSGKHGSESSGAAYPNDTATGKAGHGGQSKMAYHGTGQLGEQKTGDNENAVTQHD